MTAIKDNYETFRKGYQKAIGRPFTMDEVPKYFKGWDDEKSEYHKYSQGMELARLMA
jgi:hypothetical protein